MIVGGRGATFSDDGKHRFRLWRVWNHDAPRMLFVMLNPSTADAHRDDPTIRRCAGFAMREKCGGFEVVNLLTQCTAHPSELRPFTASDAPVRDALARCQPIVVAWGSFSSAPARVRRMLVYQVERVVSFARDAGQPLWCLGKTSNGQPRHPLRLRADQPLQPWSKP